MERQSLISEIVDTYGYREPTDQQVQYCISFIEREYFNKDHRIKEAFRFAADNDELKTIFSVKEIIRVMKYWQQHHSQPEYKPLPDRQPTPEELTCIEADFKKALIREYRRYCEKGVYYLTPGYCYHYLEEKGIIPDGYSETEEIKKLAKEATRQKTFESKGYVKAQEVLKQIEANNFGKDEKSIMRTKRQEVAFEQFIEGCKNDNVDLEAKINAI